MNKKIKQHYRWMQTARKLHRISGISLAIFLLIVSVTGILLGWKKNSHELLMPNTYKGTTEKLSDWLPLDSLNKLANSYLLQAVSSEVSTLPDRIDIRQTKGVAKFRYKAHNWSVQVDGATGELLHIGKRRADIIEEIHDGSIVDRWFGISNGFFKLFFTSAMGVALIIFVLTGFWLWYGAKQLQKLVNQQK